jgi:hypothetical protein
MIDRNALALCFLAGMLLSPLSDLAMEPAQRLYDHLSPVVSMEGDVVARAPDSVDIHLAGVKHRQCKYIGIRAYARTTKALADVNAIRIDMPADGSTKPVDHIDAGVWRVWPIASASEVLMYVQHDCNGRVVVTQIAEVKL